MSADLELRDVSFRHIPAGEYAVRNFSLEVAAGQMVALLGSSGSGKSTVLRLAAGLEDPQDGDVLIGGSSALGIAPQKRGITMMFQKPLLFPHLSVIDNVAFAGRIAGRSRRDARANAARFLDLVHLSHLAQRRSRQLSGGQEQRVSLARALAANPAVLLLDEPFGALDAAVRASMYDLLEEVRAVLDPTIVLVTHDLAEAALADHVAVLGNGSVAQLGTVAELHAKPRSVDVARLLGGFNEIGGQVVDDGVQGVLHRSSAGIVSLLHQGDLAHGPATLLVHRHSVRLHPRSERATPSDPHTPHAPGAPRAPEAPEDVGSNDLCGTVTRLRPTGLRTTVTVALGLDLRHSGDGASLEADVPNDLSLRVGQAVNVSFADSGVWAVPAPSPAADQAVTYSSP